MTTLQIIFSQFRYLTTDNRNLGDKYERLITTVLVANTQTL